MAQINDRDLESVVLELQSIAEELRDLDLDLDPMRGRAAAPDTEHLADRLTTAAEQLEQAIED